MELVICWDIVTDKWDLCLKRKGWNKDPSTWDGRIHVPEKYRKKKL